MFSNSEYHELAQERDALEKRVAELEGALVKALQGFDNVARLGEEIGAANRTVEAATNATISSLRQRVEVLLPLRDAVGRLAQQVTALERERDELQAKLKTAELGDPCGTCARQRDVAVARVDRISAILGELPDLDPDGEGPTGAEVEAMGNALLAINDAVNEGTPTRGERVLEAALVVGRHWLDQDGVNAEYINNLALAVAAYDGKGGAQG